MMMIIIAFIFTCMLIFPLVGAYWCYTKRKGEVLYINQVKTRDPRYFATSFAQMVESKWSEFTYNKWNSYTEKNTLNLSREEKVIEADTRKKYPNPCDAIVVAEKKVFRPPLGINFSKEIYAMQNAVLKGPIQIRAIACKRNLDIGSNVEVTRWADAVGVLTVKDNCDLGICISSLKEIRIGKNCKFRRLYAPKIYLGYHEEKIATTHVHKNIKEDKINFGNVKRNIKYVDDSMLNEEGLADYTVVTKYELIILENIVVVGHLRSQKSIRICDNAIIYGNIFAEENIKIGRNVTILGNVFSQEDITIEEGSIVGEEDNISSVIARGTIIFEKDCVVCGYVSNEQGGTICSGVCK